MKRMDEGFTIVEVIVTVIIAAIFLGLFIQLQSLLSSQVEAKSRHTTALAIADVNLAKYQKKSSLQSAGFNCGNHNSSARPFTLLHDSSANKEPLPNPQLFTQQKVVAWGNGDCRNSEFIVESSISYRDVGNTLKTVKQVTYAY